MQCLRVMGSTTIAFYVRLMALVLKDAVRHERSRQQDQAVRQKVNHEQNNIGAFRPPLLPTLPFQHPTPSRQINLKPCYLRSSLGCSM